MIGRWREGCRDWHAVPAIGSKRRRRWRQKHRRLGSPILPQRGGRVGPGKLLRFSAFGVEEGWPEPPVSSPRVSSAAPRPRRRRRQNEAGGRWESSGVVGAGADVETVPQAPRRRQPAPRGLRRRPVVSWRGRRASCRGLSLRPVSPLVSPSLRPDGVWALLSTGSKRPQIPERLAVKI